MLDIARTVLYIRESDVGPPAQGDSLELRKAVFCLPLRHESENG
jgi:hypothetical protein